MKKLLLFAINFCICIIVNAVTDLSKVDSNLSALTVSKQQCDTINFYSRLTAPDNKLLLYCASWCPPSYRELNRLYTDGVIDSLINNNFNLIILSDNYPCLNLQHYLIEGNWDKRVLEDFEIYYETDNADTILKALSGNNMFPFLLLVKDGAIIKKTYGLQDSYSDIIPLIKSQRDKSPAKCPVCNGTGRIKPNPHGGPEQSVGICTRCGGSGRIFNCN